MAAIPASTASSNVSCSNRSSIAYPDSDSSGKSATKAPSAEQAAAASRIRVALTAGSAKATTLVHAATRAKPWS